MAKLNLCFRRTFVFFNVLFAIFGAVVLGLGLLVHLQLNEHEDKRSAVAVLVGFGAITFFLAVLGAYGAQKENKIVLRVFFGFMCVGTIVLLRMAIPMASSRSKIMSTLKEEFNKMVPLNEAREDVKAGLDYLQIQAKCCGLFNGYEDWGAQVPESCDCKSDQMDQCQMMIRRNIYMELIAPSKNRRVYSKSCGAIILEYVDLVFDIVLGVLFSFAALAILGGVLSLAMIVHITSVPTSPPPMFSLSPPPPKYSELIESAK